MRTILTSSVLARSAAAAPQVGVTQPVWPHGQTVSVYMAGGPDDMEELVVGDELLVEDGAHQLFVARVYAPGHSGCMGVNWEGYVTRLVFPTAKWEILGRWAWDLSPGGGGYGSPEGLFGGYASVLSACAPPRGMRARGWPHGGHIADPPQWTE